MKIKEKEEQEEQEEEEEEEEEEITYLKNKLSKFQCPSLETLNHTKMDSIVGLA